MHKIPASLTLLASLTLSSTLFAGPWNTQLHPRDTEVKRLLLNTAYTVRKTGSAGPSQLYNRGAGYSIAGLPKGDVIIGLSNTGYESTRPLMAMFDRGKHLTLDEQSTLYCHSSPGPFISPGYSVFLPIGIDSRSTVSSTHIELTLGVQKDNVTRLRVARNYASVATGFNSSLNDHLLLEISNGALWAWPPHIGYTGNTSDRRKIANMTTTDTDQNKLAPYKLEIDLDQPGGSCSVKLTRTNSQWLYLYQQPLPSQYCDLHNQNQLAIAIEVGEDSTSTPAPNAGSSLCLSSMDVVSELVP